MKIFKKIACESMRWLDFVVSNIPGAIGIKLRQRIIGRRFKQCGYNIAIGMGVKVTGYKNIEIGANVTIGDYSSLHACSNGLIRIGDNFGMNTNSTLGASGGGAIIIGKDVMIAQNVVIRTADHCADDLLIPMSQQGYNTGVIEIGDDCWIAANAVVLKNVCIGSHSIVAAGAVLIKNVEPYSIVGGVPAKLLKKRR